MKYLFCLLTVTVCTLPACVTAHANEALPSPDSSLMSGPKIYIDCSYCDEDYLRTEIGFVRFVRDRKLADVHVLVSTQRTGSGGREFSLEFIGLGRYNGQTDTLRFFALESDTDDTIRREMARVIKLGTVRYAATTPLAKHLSVRYDQPSLASEVTDKWNYWVFQISGNGWFRGEESYHNINFWGEIEAERITDGSKSNLRLFGNYNESKYEYLMMGETITTLSVLRGHGVSSFWYLSLTDHWSAGLSAGAYARTYTNRDFDGYGGPAVEYNIFPYNQSTRRQMRFVYRVRSEYVDYTEMTIFDKTHEWLFSQSLGVAVELIQPWGSIYSELTGSHYLNDLKKNNLTWWSRLSIRLFEGFSLNLNGNLSRVRDLLSLPKGEASEEDILLRQRQLATSYEYWGSVGISYTFGSIYNNIVNARFGN